MSKAIVTTVVIAALALGLWASSDFWMASSEAADVNTADQENAVFQVTGMTCDACEAVVKMAVRQLDGIHQVEASYKESNAVVSYEPSKVKPEEIKVAIEKIGYQAELQ